MEQLFPAVDNPRSVGGAGGMQMMNTLSSL